MAGVANPTYSLDFSMGPVDPSMGDLPFQRLTFSPSYMYSSRLMRCLFICDYILKWMVTGSEVQFKPNTKAGEWFKVRSINDGLMKHLPDQLHVSFYQTNPNDLFP